ncbi:hypothetical protein Dxin01_00035 [Deinococcus xinjiangensis]|uniref:Uncharacterized protein n=1 Tax=Deinococcus xinjiangensis TaxID=457454 RepID=A0ABP9V808_9DEIO
MAEEVKSDLVKVANQLMAKSGGEVCKMLNSRSKTVKTWLCVYRNPPSYPRFTLKRFSVPADINFAEFDVSDSVMTDIEELDVETIEEVETAIRDKYGEELGTFQSPWAANCPF